MQIRTALTEAYQTLSTEFAEATALKKDAQSAFDAVSEDYRQGKFGYLDVLDAQRSSLG